MTFLYEAILAQLVASGVRGITQVFSRGKLDVGRRWRNRFGIFHVKSIYRYIKWKEKVQKNTQLSLWWKAKSSSYENYPRGSSLFSSWRKDCPVLKHSRVSEVFKG